MKKENIWIGKHQLRDNRGKVDGSFVEKNDESYYKISNFDQMDPFFMSIVSSSDHWMFISSNGALTAGRKNSDNVLFPYYTDDKIHDSNEITGSKTILHVSIGDVTYLWEPFSDRFMNAYDISRNIYKNRVGNKVVFEEVNHDLKLIITYSWSTSEKYGFVKQTNIRSESSENVNIEILDGIQNILPYGLYEHFQNEFSTLGDGYKKNELISGLNIGLFSMSSIPSDKAEPSESLKTTTVWSKGLEAEKILLSSRQLNNFRNGNDISHEDDIKAARGAYFVNSNFDLKENEEKSWIIVAEINQDSADVSNLKNIVLDEEIEKKILEDIEECNFELDKIVASADGLQFTGDKVSTTRHFSNVLFNVMRGGIPDEGYLVDSSDFKKFLNSNNKIVLERQSSFLNNMKNKLTISELIGEIEKTDDVEFEKLALEYLPFTFSRRHGDPSRPWNKFSIDIKDKYNNKILNYQGNWRDLFQNWEALALSYPKYILSMITKFLNATTADGYNPYRVTRDGYDWEKPEPDMPWANIGYWGDHQIIYLQKLLEISNKYDPGSLNKYLNEEVFAYANVPYKIKTYEELLKDPHETVDFNFELDEIIVDKEQSIGSDARFIFDDKNKLYQVNLCEKLLVPLLSKLSNFIPEGGIWMNTQRPEWNDANNALVGYGVSMVTLYYLRRYVTFNLKFFQEVKADSILVSGEVQVFLENLLNVLTQNEKALESKISDKDRKRILDGLGRAGSDYRYNLYDKGFSGTKNKLELDKVIDLLNKSLKYINHSIEANEREDGLYHSYNLMTVVNNSEIKVSNLYEMLEGQVAVLSSGHLTTKKVIRLLKALRESKLYREDQNSYILYPDRQLPLFKEKNLISDSDAERSKLIQSLSKNNIVDIIVKDDDGGLHFNGEIKNSKILREKLDNLKLGDDGASHQDEKDLLLDIYETMFNHKAFTGRSGTFYKYEGLGSIYWHMVSKLLLAVQENFDDAVKENAEEKDIRLLKEFYYEIKDGIGAHKNPADYGAFPTDPYSHTPSFTGVQQPGMTGQVKEDVISRFGELGVSVKDGELYFNRILLNDDEFLKTGGVFNYFDVIGDLKELNVNSNALAFTYCQIPVIYKLGDTDKIKLVFLDDENTEFDRLNLDKEFSKEVFNRSGKIKKIEVTFNK